MTKQCEVCGTKLHHDNNCGLCRIHFRDIYKSQRRKDVPEEVKRTCLRCDRGFTAKGRFNRICLRCTEVNRYWDKGAMGTKKLDDKAASQTDKQSRAMWQQRLYHVDLTEV